MVLLLCPLCTLFAHMFHVLPPTLCLMCGSKLEPLAAKPEKIAETLSVQEEEPTPELEEGAKTPSVELTVTKSTAITEIVAASPPDVTLKKVPDKTEVNYNATRKK